MITINGKTYSGNNLTISNNRVYIDGKEQTEDSKTINITVTGDINSIKVDACNDFTVTGSVGSVQTMSGDVECGDVTGSISTMSGDVTCKKVGGSVSSLSGKVKHL